MEELFNLFVFNFYQGGFMIRDMLIEWCLTNEVAYVNKTWYML